MHDLKCTETLDLQECLWISYKTSPHEVKGGGSASHQALPISNQPFNPPTLTLLILQTHAVHDYFIDA